LRRLRGKTNEREQTLTPPPPTMYSSSPTRDAPPALPSPRTPGGADERWRRGFRAGSSRVRAAGEETAALALRRAASGGAHAAYAVDVALVSPAFQVRAAAAPRSAADARSALLLADR